MANARQTWEKKISQCRAPWGVVGEFTLDSDGSFAESFAVAGLEMGLGKLILSSMQLRTYPSNIQMRVTARYKEGRETVRFKLVEHRKLRLVSRCIRAYQHR